LAISHTDKNTQLVYSKLFTPLIRVHTSILNDYKNGKSVKKPIVLYNVNNAISSINKSKYYPIYMDNVL
jgi:hypothetical protein